MQCALQLLDHAATRHAFALRLPGSPSWSVRPPAGPPPSTQLAGPAGHCWPQCLQVGCTVKRGMPWFGSSVQLGSERRHVVRMHAVVRQAVQLDGGTLAQGALQPSRHRPAAAALSVPAISFPLLPFSPFPSSYNLHRSRLLRPSATAAVRAQRGECCPPRPVGAAAPPPPAPASGRSSHSQRQGFTRCGARRLLNLMC